MPNSRFRYEMRVGAHAKGHSHIFHYVGSIVCGRAASEGFDASA